jgi:hypothetical protein
MVVAVTNDGETMGIRDPFSYSGRWDSVGLDCSNCDNFDPPSQWPDLNKEICCVLHGVSLEIELGKDGYKRWEWFCKDFKNKNALPKAVDEFNSIRDLLATRILYRAYGRDGELLEIDMNRLGACPKKLDKKK